MPDNPRMNVTLTPELEAFVRQRVDGGEFRSADAVVCEGLRLLQRNEEIRLKVDEGWAQAKAGQLLDPEEVRSRLTDRQLEWKRKRGLA